MKKVIITVETEEAVQTGSSIPEYHGQSITMSDVNAFTHWVDKLSSEKEYVQQVLQSTQKQKEYVWICLYCGMQYYARESQSPLNSAAAREVFRQKEDWFYCNYVMPLFTPLIQSCCLYLSDIGYKSWDIEDFKATAQMLLWENRLKYNPFHNQITNPNSNVIFLGNVFAKRGPIRTAITLLNRSTAKSKLEVPLDDYLELSQESQPDILDQIIKAEILAKQAEHEKTFSSKAYAIKKTRQWLEEDDYLF